MTEHNDTPPTDPGDIVADLKAAIEEIKQMPPLQREAIVSSPAWKRAVADAFGATEVSLSHARIWGIPIHVHPNMVGWQLVGEHEVEAFLAALDERP